MTNCTQELFHFSSFDRRKIEASFTGGDVSPDISPPDKKASASGSIIASG